MVSYPPKEMHSEQNALRAKCAWSKMRSEQNAPGAKCARSKMRLEQKCARSKMRLEQNDLSVGSESRILLSEGNEVIMLQ